MRQERLLNQILFAKVNGKRPVRQPRTKWLSWLEPFGILSNRNAVCVGGSRSGIAQSEAATHAVLKEKQDEEKKKRTMIFFVKL